MWAGGQEWASEHKYLIIRKNEQESTCEWGHQQVSKWVNITYNELPCLSNRMSKWAKEQARVYEWIHEWASATMGRWVNMWAGPSDWEQLTSQIVKQESEQVSKRVHRQVHERVSKHNCLSMWSQKWDGMWGSFCTKRIGSQSQILPHSTSSEHTFTLVSKAPLHLWNNIHPLKYLWTLLKGLSVV